MTLKTCKGWFSRGYLPHFDWGSIAQSVTFRLADSLPVAKYKALCEELESMPKARAEEEHLLRVDEMLDGCLGQCHLRRDDIAQIVEDSLLFFDGSRYQLHAWTIMPNHVHVLLTPRPDESISSIMFSIKSYTANKANKCLDRTGNFWQREYFDKFIRDEAHYHTTVQYIENNPVKAGLCVNATQWRFGSARRREGNATVA